jgi:tRNA (mo5U34)-methyltransferase
LARREQAISRKSRASDPGLSPEALQAGVRRLAPFHHDIELAPGIRTYVPELARREFEKTRLQSLLDHAWPTLLAATGGSLVGKRVLDVACN